MSIIGFGLDKVFAERTADLEKNSQIKNNLKITSLKEFKLNILVSG